MTKPERLKLPKLQKIAARAAAAEPGPWQFIRSEGQCFTRLQDVENQVPIMQRTWPHNEMYVPSQENQAFIENAQSDILDLLAHIAWLQERRTTASVLELMAYEATKQENEKLKTALADYEKAIQSLLNKVNKVTAYHIHGNPMPEGALDELSDRQVETEERLRQIQVTLTPSS